MTSAQWNPLSTVFRITGALSAANREALLSIDPNRDRPSARPRILVAEDHPANRKLVELILGATGAELVSVANGAEAVTAAVTQVFDLILMDVQMPVMDGLTAIRAIRAREAVESRARTPIYALTADALPEHAEASLAAGADGHVAKPVTAATLVGLLGSALSGERPPAPRLRSRKPR